MVRRSSWLACPLVVAFGVAVCSPIIDAHEFKLDAVINEFVTVEPGQAHVVVRVPLYLFPSAKFPVKNVEIDVPRTGAAMERALAAIQQDVALFEGGRRLSASTATGRLSLPSDRSFQTYGEALRHIAEPVAQDMQIYIDQGYVDAHLTYALQSSDPELSVRTTAGPEFGNSLKVTVRYKSLDGADRTLMLTSGSGTVALNPTWWRAATGFVGLGMEHILTGVDHMLFLLCLVIPLRGWRPILAIVTTFTVAHSFTLIGSAFHLVPGGAWFPPFVETAIAASIVYMALENIIGIDLVRRMLIAGIFGLIHGFGFAYGLQENLQFAGSHLLVSLLAFNVGIELGQVLLLALMLPALLVIRRYVLPGRVGMIILSALVAQTGWQWMMERGAVLLTIPWPRPAASAVATLMMWIAGLLLAAGGLRFIATRLRFDSKSGAEAQRGVAD